jgi:hypothetical protein
LSYLLKFCDGLEGTDPRDKIFALLGLATEKSAAVFPDYNNPVEEVYIKTVALVLQFDKELGGVE